MIEIGATLDTIITLFRRYKALIAIVPLILALGVQTARIEGFLWFDGFKERLALREAQIAKMEQASKQARADQIALNTENSRLSERIATNAALEHARLESAVDRALADYAGRNRVRPACRSVTGQTDPAPLHPDPGAPAGPDSAPDMVAIPREDFEKLGKAAVRGAEATGFLNDLVDEGLAIVIRPVTAADLPEPAFGQR